MTTKIKIAKPPRRYQPGFLRKLDRRSVFNRRLLAFFNNIVADLGGEENLSTIQLSLIEEFACLKAYLVTLAKQINIEEESETDPKVVAQWIAANNSYQGMAKTLGLKMHKKAAPDLQAYRNGKRA